LIAAMAMIAWAAGRFAIKKIDQAKAANPLKPGSPTVS
jgi:hypothetical protein